MEGIIEITADGCKGFINVNELAAVINGSLGVTLIFKGGVAHIASYRRPEDAQDFCDAIINALHDLRNTQKTTK